MGQKGTSDTEAELRWQALMRASQAGDPRAYDALLQACLPVIRRMAWQNGIAPQTIDDVVQDSLLTLHRARHTYDPARPFLPWLRAVVQRRGIDQMRRNGRQSSREVHAPVAYELHPDPSDGAEHSVAARERARRLQEAVGRLPEKQRKAVQLLALQERTLAEVSAASGRSVVALKVTLHRAVKALRAGMAPLEA